MLKVPSVNQPTLCGNGEEGVKITISFGSRVYFCIEILVGAIHNNKCSSKKFFLVAWNCCKDLAWLLN